MTEPNQPGGMIASADNQEPTPERDRALAISEADDLVASLERKIEKEQARADAIADLKAALKEAKAARKELD